MRRIVVIGNAGSGKSTLARTLAGRLGLPYLELDSVYHQAGWTPLSIEEFRARAGEFVAQDGWVVDGNYSPVQDVVWPRADTVIWLDFPRWRVTARILRRTLRRVVRREELWNGNREQARNLLRLDRSANIILWSWTNHSKYPERFAAARRNPSYGHIDFVRLGNRRDIAALLDRAGAAG